MSARTAPSRRAQDAGLLLLRVAAGGFLLPHGFGKLFGWFGGPGITGFAAELRDFGLPAPTPLPLLLALAQTGLGLAVVAGLCTRLAASLAALFIAGTAVLAWPNGWFWNLHGMEYPVFWTLVLLAITLQGAGAWSLDGRAVARHA